MDQTGRTHHRHHRLIELVVILAVIIFLAAVWFFGKHQPAVRSSATKSNKPTASSSGPPPQSAFNKNQYSINDAASLWVVVNKGRILPSTYVPANLVAPNIPLRLSASSSEMHVRADTAQAMETMFTAAESVGVKLMLASGYRSYNEQIGLYNGYVSSQGQAAADASSARPGHSEHQTGLAADVEPASRTCEVEECFDTTSEGQWLAANCYKYGFIIRYQKGQESLTGYEYEPWHIRYVGIALAAQIHSSGKTLEQFFGLPTYADYPAASYQLR